MNPPLQITITKSTVKEESRPTFFTGLSRTVVLDKKCKKVCEDCHKELDTEGSYGHLCYSEEYSSEKKTKKNSRNDSFQINTNFPTLSKENLLEIINTAKRNSASSDSNSFCESNTGDISFGSSDSYSSPVGNAKLKRKNSFEENSGKRHSSYSSEFRTPISYPQNSVENSINIRNSIEESSFERRLSFPTNFSSPRSYQEAVANGHCSSSPGFSPVNVKNYNKKQRQQNKYKLLNDQILHLYGENKQTEQIYNKKMHLRSTLHEVLLQRFSTCGLYVVGSSMTGLGVTTSDMDMCLMLTDEEIDQKKQAINMLHEIRRMFLKLKFLKRIQVIPAVVPIIKFVDFISGIEVDLNINNGVGIRNTQLLSSYARLDPRFPPLILFVKLWAKHNNINDAKNQSLSSYSLVLMVIHYLQFKCKPPVLPCLQSIEKNKYLPTTAIRNLKLKEDLPNFVSQNTENLGELFVGFLKYFSDEFNYVNSVISVRLGRVLPKFSAVRNSSSPNNKQGHWKFFGIEEPFDLTNTARSVFNPDVFEYIKWVFRNTLEKVEKRPHISSIL